MGIKGDKMQKGSTESAEFMVASLSSIGGITIKKMFGGYGIFHNGKMFGIVDPKGNAFLKANDSNAHFYEERSATKHSKMSYYSIPIEVLENKSELINWSQKAINIIK